MKLLDSRRWCEMGLGVLVFGGTLHLALGGWVGEVIVFAGAAMLLWSQVAPLEGEG